MQAESYKIHLIHYKIAVSQIHNVYAYYYFYKELICDTGIIFDLTNIWKPHYSFHNFC